ncbi:4663_t:CDS:1, partial [Scutellospora calospora]
VLEYIKNFYKSLYKAEPIDLQAAEELLRNAPLISQDQNDILVKP